VWYGIDTGGCRVALSTRSPILEVRCVESKHSFTHSCVALKAALWSKVYQVFFQRMFSVFKFEDECKIKDIYTEFRLL
jgi:hypothetical protein